MLVDYPRPSHGVHLTFINNHKVSQSDNDTIMLSLIVLNAKHYNNTAKEFPIIDLISFVTSSDFANQQILVSQIKFFIDTGTTLMCMCPL